MSCLPNYKTLKLLSNKLGFIAIISLINVANAHAFTVHDAIISAHEHNQGLLSKYEDYRSAKLQTPQAITDFLPTAKFSKQNSENRYKFPIVAATAQKYTRNDSFTVTQPLFNSGGSVAKLLSANQAVESAYEAFKAVSNKLSVDVVTAYEKYLTAQKVQEFSVKNEEVFKEHLKYAEIRFEHGEVTKTDVYQAKATHAKALADLQSAEGVLNTAAAELQYQIGTALPKAMEAIDISGVTIPATLEEARAIALKNNPTLLSAKARKEAADYQIYAITSRALPNVTAQASINRSNSPVNSRGNSDGKTYTINLSIPIDPSSYLNIQDSQYKAYSAKYSANDIEAQLENDIIQAWSSYKTSLALITSNKEAIVSAQEALDGIKEEYKVGTRTTLDVLTAENNLFISRINLRNAQRDYVIALFTILQLMGSIEGVDIEEIANNQ